MSIGERGEGGERDKFHRTQSQRPSFAHKRVCRSVLPRARAHTQTRASWELPAPWRQWCWRARCAERMQGRAGARMRRGLSWFTAQHPPALLLLLPFLILIPGSFFFVGGRERGRCVRCFSLSLSLPSPFLSSLSSLPPSHLPLISLVKYPRGDC